MPIHVHTRLECHRSNSNETCQYWCRFELWPVTLIEKVGQIKNPGIFRIMASNLHNLIAVSDFSSTAGGHQVVDGSSACQEKYLQELSVTRTWGTSRELNHSRGPGVSHRDYFAWRKWGISEQEWLSPRLPLHLMEFEGIWGNICNWKWIKWLRRLLFLFTGAIDHAPRIILWGFMGAGAITPISWQALW
jgi:hypothetical protein